jgi:hypothetical protein
MRKFTVAGLRYVRCGVGGSRIVNLNQKLACTVVHT